LYFFLNRGVEKKMSLLETNRAIRNRLCEIHTTLTGQVCTCNVNATLMPELYRDINWLMDNISEACGVSSKRDQNEEEGEVTKRGRSRSKSKSPVRDRRRARSRSPVATERRRAKEDDPDEPKSVYVYYDVGDETEIPRPFYSQQEKLDEEARLGNYFTVYGCIVKIRTWFYDHKELGRKVPVAKVVFRHEDEKAKCLANYDDILTKYKLKVRSSKF